MKNAWFMKRMNAQRRIVMAVGVGAVVVALGALGWLGPVRWVYGYTLEPVVRALAGGGSALGGTLAQVGRVKDLARENAALRQQNAELRQQAAADAETRRDNEILRRELGLEAAGTPRQVGAEVVGYQPDSYRKFVTINRGSKQGLKTGMAVLSEGTVAGVLQEVQANSARVMLVSDPEFKLTAKDQDTGALGLVEGQVGAGLVMEQIGQTDVVRPNDAVTTTGLGGVVPSGLLIGQVASVNAGTDAVFQSARISSALRPEQLRFVFVVAP